ncbi:MAG: stage II sporulation protein D [Oscillospiraceae bacterium]|nr:stage II sporulation protein D [Oscillospiraceae bacterium]
MKDSVISTCIVVLFWAVLPILCCSQSLAAQGSTDTGGWAASSPSGLFSPQPPEQTEDGTEAAPEDSEAPGFDRAFRMPVLRGDTTVSMDLHSYLTGVLLAEMPLSFEDEALKAQAVASRTYALRSYSSRRHDPCAVCVNSGCCQGWTDPDSVSPEERARAEAIVSETDGLVVCYQGELIEATFFSCSGGQTEAAVAVWGSELPYLQAVESPGEEGATHYEDETQIPLSEFREALAEQDAAVQFPDALGAWVGSIRYTPGGGVDEIELGGRPFKGTWLRQRFHLRSTAFTLELTDTEAVFTTKGFGHRVGMSQYGAEAMAKAGSSFEEILAWYYQGTNVEHSAQ